MGFDAASVMAMSGLALYAGLFFLPFIQEDAAVITAATASISNAGPIAYIFAAILIGLTMSDKNPSMVVKAVMKSGEPVFCRVSITTSLAERPGRASS